MPNHFTSQPTSLMLDIMVRVAGNQLAEVLLAVAAAGGRIVEMEITGLHHRSLRVACVGIDAQRVAHAHLVETLGAVCISISDPAQATVTELPLPVDEAA